MAVRTAEGTSPPLVDTFPPVRGPRRGRLLVAVAGAVLLVAVVSLVWLGTRTTPAPEPPPPAPSPVVPSPVVPSPVEPEPVPEVVVSIASIAVEVTDNAELFGGVPSPPDAQEVGGAVEACRSALQGYLTDVFVQPGTRFTATPLPSLLGSRALASLSAADEEALGVLGWAARSSRARPVTASATVVADADGVELILLSYDAVVDVRLEDGREGQLAQHAGVAFVPEGAAWRADAVDATLQVAGALEE